MHCWSCLLMLLFCYIYIRCWSTLVHVNFDSFWLMLSGQLLQMVQLNRSVYSDNAVMHAFMPCSIYSDKTFMRCFIINDLYRCHSFLFVYRWIMMFGCKNTECATGTYCKLCIKDSVKARWPDPQWRTVDRYSFIRKVVCDHDFWMQTFKIPKMIIWPCWSRCELYLWPFLIKMKIEPNQFIFVPVCI